MSTLWKILAIAGVIIMLTASAEAQITITQDDVDGWVSPFWLTDWNNNGIDYIFDDDEGDVIHIPNQVGAFEVLVEEGTSIQVADNLNLIIDANCEFNVLVDNEDAGAFFTFGEDARLTIRGVAVMDGDALHRISFYPIDPGETWDGIYFEETADDCFFDCLDFYGCQFAMDIQNEDNGSKIWASNVNIWRFTVVGLYIDNTEVWASDWVIWSDRGFVSGVFVTDVGPNDVELQSFDIRCGDPNWNPDGIRMIDASADLHDSYIHENEGRGLVFGGDGVVELGNIWDEDDNTIEENDGDEVEVSGDVELTIFWQNIIDSDGAGGIEPFLLDNETDNEVMAQDNWWGMDPLLIDPEDAFDGDVNWEPAADEPFSVSPSSMISLLWKSGDLEGISTLATQVFRNGNASNKDIHYAANYLLPAVEGSVGGLRSALNTYEDAQELFEGRGMDRMFDLLRARCQFKMGNAAEGLAIYREMREKADKKGDTYNALLAEYKECSVLRRLADPNDRDATARLEKRMTEILIATGERTGYRPTERPATPTSLILNQAYPNPFNSTTTFSFGLPEAIQVDVGVYDCNGHLIQSLISGYTADGYHSISWNALDVPAGVYLVKLQAGQLSRTSKLILMK